VLRQVAEGVLIHESEFIQSNALVVQGRPGVLLIDPGIQGSEMACLANDMSDSGQTVCGRLLDCILIGTTWSGTPAARRCAMRAASRPAVSRRA
jgi:hypothetical protein